jgi:hypothetical protein
VAPWCFYPQGRRDETRGSELDPGYDGPPFPLLYPSFSGVRGRGILRTSQKSQKAKFAEFIF